MSDTTNDSTYLARLRQRAQEAQQDEQKAERSGTDNAYLASLQLRAQQGREDERDAQHAAQREVRKQRRRLRM